MRDCSTCRDSRGLITWARVCARDSFLLSSAWNGDGAGVCGEPRIQREWERERETRARDRPHRNPQDQSILDSCAAAGIVSAGKSRRLCVLCSRIDPPLSAQTAAAPHPRINCERINAPFGERRRRLIVCAERLLSPGRFEHRHHHLEDDAIADGIN